MADQMNETRIIDVVNAQAGEFRERAPQADVDLLEAVQKAKKLYKPFAFREAKLANGRAMKLSLLEALVQQPDAANMLRDDIRFMAITAFAEMPITYPAFTRTMPSSNEIEYYLRDSAMGRIPRVRSGEASPYLLSSFEGSAAIRNFAYRGRVKVLGDDIRFDRIGKIMQTAALLGRSGRVTEEAEVYDVITTTANYTRAATSGDNDIQANYQNAYALSHENFEKAIATITTAKDRNSGQYLGLVPDTVICGPLAEWAWRKLLSSERMSNGTDSERGDLNVYRGAIKRIIVSPYFTTSYDWALVDSRRDGLIKQDVEAFSVTQTTRTADSESWRVLDAVEYDTRGYFGVGFVDDRPWFYAVNSTRPTL